MNWLKEKKHKVIAALLIFGLLPLAAYAQQEVLMTGQDSSGNTRTIRVDTDGKVVTSTTTSSSSTTSGAATYEPTATSTTLSADSDACTSATDTDCTNILPTTASMLSWRRIAITITNTGSNTLSDCVISWSADGSNWEAWDDQTFDALGAGTTVSINIDGNARKFLRIDASSASGTSTTVTLTAAAN